MPHPLYSPDLASSDFWLFGYLKQQRDTYSDSESFKKAVTKIIHDVSRDGFRKTFNK